MVKSLKGIILFVLPLLLACSGQNQKEEVGKELELRFELIESSINSSIRGIWVLNSDCIWMSGASGTIIRSLDGGSSWQKLPAPDNDSLDFRDIHAFSEESALIVSAGFPVKVYLTRNSGLNWELVYENLDSSAFMNSVHFRDSLNGLIVGDVLNKYHFLMESKDGGRNWKRIDSSRIAKPLPVEHAFAASGSCITVNDKGEYLVAFGGQKSRVLKQKGDEWVAVDLPVNDSLASSGIYSIASGDGMLMTAGGDYTKEDQEWPVISSLDGGISWENAGLSYNGYRSVVDYSSKMNLWLAAGSNGVDLLHPDGVGWVKVFDQSINTLQFDRSSDLAWAAGPKGHIYRIHFTK